MMPKNYTKVGFRYSPMGSTDMSLARLDVEEIIGYEL
jgi:hypothetical protein